MFNIVILLLLLVPHVSSDDCVVDRQWRTTIKNEIDRLNGLDIFPPDFQFTKRVAYLESHYGCNLINNMSGIWQMSLNQLGRITQIDKEMANKIQSSLGININHLNYDRGDLTNVTIALVAFRCYIHRNLSLVIPPDIKGQATLWANTYRKDSNVTNIFTGSVDRMPDDCASHAGDIIFITDSSATWFRSFLDAFVTSPTTKIGPNNFDIAIVDFSDSAEILLELQSCCNKTCLEDIKHYGRNRNMVDGLTKAMQVANRSRNSVSPKNAFSQTAVLITERNPGDIPNTKISAADLKSAGIKLFTVGIGQRLNPDFLKEISSQPEFAHYYPLEDYASLAEGFSYELLAHTCYSQAILDSKGGQVECILQQTETRFFSIVVKTMASLNVTLMVNTGHCVVYVSKKEKFPSQYSHDRKKSVDDLGQIYLSPDYLQSATRKSRSIQSTEFDSDSGFVTVNLAMEGMQQTNNCSMTYHVGDTPVTTTVTSTTTTTATTNSTTTPSTTTTSTTTPSTTTTSTTTPSTTTTSTTTPSTTTTSTTSPTTTVASTTSNGTKNKMFMTLICFLMLLAHIAN